MAQVLAEDERTRMTANALELVTGEDQPAAVDVTDTVDGVVIEEMMDVVDAPPTPGPSDASPKKKTEQQRKVKNTSIYNFEFSSDEEPDVSATAHEETKEELVEAAPVVKKRPGRPRKTNTTTTVRKSSRKRNPSKN